MALARDSWSSGGGTVRDSSSPGAAATSHYDTRFPASYAPHSRAMFVVQKDLVMFEGMAQLQHQPNNRALCLQNASSCQDDQLVRQVGRPGRLLPLGKHRKQVIARATVNSTARAN